MVCTYQLRLLVCTHYLLPVVGRQEDLLFCSDDDIAVMLHDIRDKRNDGERHGRRGTDQIRRNETGQWISLQGRHDGHVHLPMSARTPSDFKA